MSDPIAVIPSRVPFLDKRTGNISREWYLLIVMLVNRVGGGAGLDLDDLALGAPVGSNTSVLDSLLVSLSDVLGAQPVVQASEPVDELNTAPAVPFYGFEDQLYPVYQIGTLGEQNSDRVVITGGRMSGVTITTGSINNTPIGATTANTGKFTSLTANTGKFTSLTATAGADIAAPNTSAVVKIARTTSSAGEGYLGADSAFSFRVFNSAFADTLTVEQSATPLAVTASGISTLGSAAISGNVVAGAGFGCNAKGAQGAFALGAGATDLPTVIALANNIRTALINNGIGS